MVGELPGANILALMMQAPTDAMALATKQVTETMAVLSMGAQAFGAELATPPSMAGLALPPFPGMPAAQAVPAPAPAQGFAAFRKPLDIVI